MEVWFPVCFFYEKHKKHTNTKFKEQRRVLKEHIFGVLCVFKNGNETGP